MLKSHRLKPDGTFIVRDPMKLRWPDEISLPEICEQASHIHHVCLHTYGAMLAFDTYADSQRSDPDKEIRSRHINSVFTSENPRDIMDWLGQHHGSFSRLRFSIAASLFLREDRNVSTSESFRAVVSDVRGLNAFEKRYADHNRSHGPFLTATGQHLNV